MPCGILYKYILELLRKKLRNSTKIINSKFRLNRNENFINMSTANKEYTINDSILTPFNKNAKLLKLVCISISFPFALQLKLISIIRLSTLL